MKVWKAIIKERCNKHLVTPEYYGESNEKFLISFWGLNEPDVEWYKLYCVEE